MAIKYNGTTVPTYGTIKYNGANVTTVKYKHGGTTTTVWQKVNQYFPSVVSFATGGAGASLSSVTSTKLKATITVVSGFTNANCHSTTAQNLTNVTKIKFHVSARSITSGSNCETSVGVCKTQNPNTYASYSANGGKAVAVSGTGDYEVNVSSLSGSGFYICISVWGSTGDANLEVTNITWE